MSDTIPPDAPIQQTQDRTLVVLCHLLGLAGFTGIPFANVLAPLFLWLWKKEGNPEVDAHGKEAINFQISVTIYAIIAGLTILIIIGFALLPLVLISALVLTIIAALEASKGRFYRYPLTIRFLK
jgi:uncharacterized Tic20 family protein